MPTGRPDYWYGTALYFVDAPSDGEVTRGPTSNWAYDHENDANAHHTPTVSGDVDHDDVANVTASQHHTKYADGDAVSAMGAKGDANALHHDRYADGDAVSAMGAKGDGNPLHHDKYLDAEAVSAMGAKGDANPLNHDLFKPEDIIAIDLGKDVAGEQDVDLKFYSHSTTVLCSRIRRGSGYNDHFLFTQYGVGNIYFWAGGGYRLSVLAGGGVGYIWDDTPTNGETAKGVTSDWAYDHVHNAEAHHVKGDVYVDRGETAAWDWDVNDFTIDGNWHDLNLSSLVGVHSCLAHLRLEFQNNTLGELVVLRQKGSSTEGNAARNQVIVVNQQHNFEALVKTDGGGEIQYNISNGGTWASMNIIVRGRWEIVSG